MKLVTSCQNYPPRIIKTYFFYILSLFVLFAQFLVGDMKKKKSQLKKNMKNKHEKDKLKNN